MQVAVIENSPVAPIGTFGAWLRDARGAALTTIAGQQAAERREEIAAADLVVTLGSPDAAYDPQDWIIAQRGVLADLVAQDRAVIGICFGAQLLAAALGGTVAALSDDRRRLGWVANDETAGPVWTGSWLRWNGDHFSAPPGSEVLARSGGTVQAFRFRRALGVQFHPEAVAGDVGVWIDNTPAGHLGGREPRALQAELVGCLDRSGPRREALFAEMLRLTLG